MGELQRASRQATSLVDRAHKDIVDLNEKFSEASKNKVCSIRIKDDVQLGKHFQKVVALVPTGAVSRDCNRLALQITCDLWHGLNDLMGEAARFSGINAPNFTFPAMRGERGFKDGSGRRKIERLDPVFRPLIFGLEPYKGGRGDALWVVKEVFLARADPTLEYAPVWKKLVQFSHRRFGRGPHWESGKKSIPLDTGPSVRKIDQQIEFPVEIVFSGITVLNPKPVIPTLLQALKLIRQFARDVGQV